MPNEVLTKGQDLVEIWASCLSYVDAPTRSMLADAKPLSFDGTHFSIQVSAFMRDFLAKPQRCADINQVLRKITGCNELAVQCSASSLNLPVEPVTSNNQALVSAPVQTPEAASVSPQPKPETRKASDSVGVLPEAPTAAPEDYSDTKLRSDLLFDNFIRGDNNNLAAATAKAVAERPAQMYNPLFFYSGVGLGKTHLMNAIGNYILQHHRDKRVLYISAEQFTNEFIESMREPRRFREKYRNVDILLIDDIQFIINKERTQEEFFHTFNALHNSGKQIVISSDRPPKQMPTLIDRLRTRFECGMIADIQPPDLETRIAILKCKASGNGIQLSSDVLMYIAEEFHSNIRELEGALIRAVSYCTLSGLDFSLPNVKEALATLLDNNNSKLVDIGSIKRAVCEYFDIREEELVGKRRDQRIVRPRQLAMYLCKEMTESSYPEIGAQFGGRDHTTVLHAHRKVEASLNEPYYKTGLTNITEKLK